MIGRLFLTAGVAIYAFAAVANGLDRVSENSPAVERIVPPPFRAQADRSAAALALARKDTSGALRHAVAAVSHDPVDVDSAALLGSSRLLAGNDDAAAEAAYRVAARFGWRDVATQLYWYQAALLTGKYGLAADRADAILRVHPGFANSEELLAPLESIPAARPYLRQHLGRKPNWLKPYLLLLRDQDEALVDRRVAVLTEFGASGSPLGCDEVSQFTTALMDRSRRADAEHVWNANCPRQRISGLLADVDFRLVDVQPAFPFGWRAMRSGDVEVRSSAPGEWGGPLLIRSSAPSTRLVLSQSVSLRAGNYRLRLRMEDGQSARSGRLIFSFACDGPLPFPADSAGDPLIDGQVIQVGDCNRQQLGLWLRVGAAPISLKSVAIEKIG